MKLSRKLFLSYLLVVAGRAAGAGGFDGLRRADHFCRADGAHGRGLDSSAGMFQDRLSDINAQVEANFRDCRQ